MQLSFITESIASKREKLKALVESRDQAPTHIDYKKLNMRVNEMVEALERDLGKYAMYGTTSQVFKVNIEIQTISSKRVITKTPAHIYYTHVKMDEIETLVKRDIPNKNFTILGIEIVQLGTIIY